MWCLCLSGISFYLFMNIFVVRMSLRVVLRVVRKESLLFCSLIESGIRINCARDERERERMKEKIQYKTKATAFSLLDCES
jgi:hypothetical protein